MIKLIIFDLDGVLVDAKEIHYEALNKALMASEGYFIGREEHLTTYDGLPTSKKLMLLHEDRKLPKSKFDNIWKAKQKATLDIINNMEEDGYLMDILGDLKKEGYQIAVATNSIRQTTKMMLIRKGFMEYIDFFYSNQDVKNPKPQTEMYLKCMIKAEVNPDETLILEDSHIGRKAVLSSGAHLLPIENVEDVTYKKIKNELDKLNKIKEKKVKWIDKKMNVLIPMAGAGSRFEKAGYTFPKPLIAVHGKPMIQVVVENLNIDAHFIFIVQREHCKKYQIDHMLSLIAPGCDIVVIDGITEGAACTTLLAKDLINSEKPLLIANSDQWIKWDSNTTLYSMTSDGIDGGILTFQNTHPKWSYAKLGENGFVSNVAEKMPISTNATVGIYYWRHGSDYVKYAEQMIQKNIRTNNEFYVAPVYNEAIADGKKIKISEVKEMHGLGDPESLNEFLRLEIEI